MKILGTFIWLFFSMGVLFAQPTITGISPTSGPINTVVTINGTNFNPMASSNIVYFGATRSAVTSATATQLTLTVPAGATYQPISVTTVGLTAWSNRPFTVTFTNGGAFELPGSSASSLNFTSHEIMLGISMGLLSNHDRTVKTF